MPAYPTNIKKPVKYVVEHTLHKVCKDSIEFKSAKLVKESKEEIIRIDKLLNIEAAKAERLYVENQQLKQMLSIRNDKDLSFAQYCLKELQRLTQVPEEKILERLEN